MTPRALAAKIEELPPDARAEVEDFVEFLARRDRRPALPGHRDEFIERLRENRERLRREYGTFDSVPIIRELREHGAR